MGVNVAHLVPDLDFELSLRGQGFRCIAGVDEVGRGSWAGPVVAAAVMLPLDQVGLTEALRQVRDSKQLSAGRRNQLNRLILDLCHCTAFGWASHQTIDRIGIAAANRLALVRAISRLPVPADALVVDYFALPESGLPQICPPHGDARSLSVAAASIVAKVMRDSLMDHADTLYPLYGFAQNKGYGTQTHRDALNRHGPSPWHRRSFRPIADVSGPS